MIKGEKCDLRFAQEQDLEKYLELDQDVSLRGEYYHYMVHTHASFRKWYAETGFWGDDYGRMYITSKKGKILGLVDYFKTAPYYAGYEIGYILYDRESRGKGITAEAVGLFVDFLFRSKPINRLEIKAQVENLGSQRIAEKCGFSFDCIVKGAMMKMNRFVDLKQYSLVLEDFLKSKQVTGSSSIDSRTHRDTQDAGA